MGWEKPNKNRKPKGYWRDFENIKRELYSFGAEKGTKRIPSLREIRRARRDDLRRAIEKWGGLRAVKELIALDDSHLQSNVIGLINRRRHLGKMNIDIRDVDKL